MNPQNFLTLLDVTKRRGTDAAVGLVEEVVAYAPELEKIWGRSIPGISYTARIRPLLTQAGMFRKANQGGVVGASVYDERRFNCYFFDSQLRIDEAVLSAAEQEGDSLAQLQAEEAEGTIRDKAIQLGKQIWQGRTIDPNGFPGMIDYFNTFSNIIDQRTGAALNLVVNAGGASAACEIVWYVRMDAQGVHLLFGKDQGIDIKPWVWQYVPDVTDPTKQLRASLSNMSGYLGLSCASPFAIGIVKNVDNTITNGAYTKPFTDAMDAQLFAKFPIGMPPTHCFMTRATRAGLQASRTVTLFGQATDATSKNSGAASNVAPIPTVTASGIPIVATDSILVGNNF